MKTGKRRLKPLRKKPTKQEAFLEAVALLGTITGAAAAVNIHRTTHYVWLNSDQKYAEAFWVAREEFADSVRDEVHRRAVIGWEDPVVYQGQIQFVKDKKGKPHMVTVRKFSDRLLELHAKAHCPEYRDKHEVTGARGGPVQIQVVYTGVPQPDTPDSRTAAGEQLLGGDADTLRMKAAAT